MSTVLLLTTATAAALLLLAAWWTRRPAPALAGARGREGCPPGGPRVCAGPAVLLAEATTEEAGASAPATPGTSTAAAEAGAPKRKKAIGPSRRAFLRNTMAVGWLGVIGGFSLASLAFLWPNLRGGFGAVIEVGNEEDLLATIRQQRAPFEFPAGRLYLVEYDPALDPDGQYAEITNGSRLMALYWRCVHLGCKVPWCMTSQWLECPCHGSRYNRWGEYRRGPAPRGLDRFAAWIEDGQLMVDTSSVVTGPPRQSPALDQPPEGPSCV